MRELTQRLAWLVDDLGLKELDAWLWLTSLAALAAGVLTLLWEAFK